MSSDRVHLSVDEARALGEGALRGLGYDAEVAPFGGIRPVLGTNPIAFAIPGAADAGGPLVLDMGTSAFMATELQLRVRLGQELPEGVAIDRDGRPTRDANEARQGALLPFG